MKLVLGHYEAIHKARRLAEDARPAITDEEFWFNDYTDDMIVIVRNPEFMNKGGFFTFALTTEDREMIVAYLLRCREVEAEEHAKRREAFRARQAA